MKINATGSLRNEAEKGYLIRLYSKSGSEQLSACSPGRTNSSDYSAIIGE